MRYWAAWTRVNQRGTPSGRLHAIADQKGGDARAICGVMTAGPIFPPTHFDTSDHAFACRNCLRDLRRILGIGVKS